MNNERFEKNTAKSTSPNPHTDYNNLLELCKSGNLQDISVVLKSEINNDIKTKVLIDAVVNEWGLNPSLITLLVNAGAKPNESLIRDLAMIDDKDIENDINRIVQIFLEHGIEKANLDFQDMKACEDGGCLSNSFTALMWAVAHGNIALAKMLLDAGADVDIEDFEGNRAVDFVDEEFIKKADIGLLTRLNIKLCSRFLCPLCHIGEEVKSVSCTDRRVPLGEILIKNQY